MITANKLNIMENFHNARVAAKEKNSSVLFSEVTKIGMLDPLSFYQSGKENYNGDRFFWQDPKKATILAGVGKIDVFQSSLNQNRYKEIEKQWENLIEHAFVIKDQDIPGTGPLLFGGFSFDSAKSNSMLWDQFGDHLFYIPKYLLSIINGQAYLTVNALIDSDDLSMLTEAGKEIDALIAKAQHFKNLPADQNVLMEQLEVFPEQWKEIVQTAINEIRTTDLDKLVLARETRLKFQSAISSEIVLNRLMLEQPASFIFCLESGSDFFIGASPEQLVQKNGTSLSSACLAGSIARGKTTEEDNVLGETLLHDQKNLIEHQYVVSMIKHAMETICGIVMVPDAPQLMKTRHIQHLYTPVAGESRSGVSIFDCVEKLHPTPAMGGLPKEKAVERIRELELLERGFYASPIGWADGQGNGEFAVAIRSALVQGNEASLFAGCGIVEDSEPQSEYIETAIKFKPMLSALGGNLHATS
ncbi:menaquinone-specific isochorismate synthase [Peribacillus deserti]|uniref:Isochorismate synthase MenF n=1 Tax=Peribacillus deserti TaxID=673318 RepID=A0ABS2QIJ4_9BACI|nr:isochorismate synthase [Peribacillus deserti]MBM7692988.1 menaquinone-specific isochorismate synthase [Peribacillus deserti]